MRTQRRSGFTLIEIIIVMSIVLLLMGLLIVALGPAMGLGRAAAVKATLTLINETIQTRTQFIQDLDVSNDAKKLVSLNPSLTEQQATFIIKKSLYRQALPQRPQDLWGFNQANDSGLKDDAPYFKPADHAWVADAANANVSSLSSALLHLALVDGKNVRAFEGGKTYPLAVLDESNLKGEHHRDVTLPGGQQVEAFYDDWDQPLRFYNFPTAFVDAFYVLATKSQVQPLLPGLPATQPTDPLDVTSTLVTPFTTAWVLNIPTSSPLNPAPVTFDLAHYHQPGKFYVPLLMSAGPDGALGLNEPNTSPNQHGSIVTLSEINDNLTNKQQ